MSHMSNFFGRIVMSYPFYIHAATSSTASQHPCRLFFAAAAVAAPFILLSNSAYAALNCTTQPTCQQLGYSKSDIDGCQNYLYCPFDKNYKAANFMTINDTLKAIGWTTIPQGYSCSSGLIWYDNGFTINQSGSSSGFNTIYVNVGTMIQSQFNTYCSSVRNIDSAYGVLVFQPN